MENNESFSGCEFQDPIFVRFRPFAFQEIEMDFLAKPPYRCHTFFVRTGDERLSGENAAKKMLC